MALRLAPETSAAVARNSHRSKTFVTPPRFFRTNTRDRRRSALLPGPGTVFWYTLICRAGPAGGSSPCYRQSGTTFYFVGGKAQARFIRMSFPPLRAS
jgi:hypothetical protein